MNLLPLTILDNRLVKILLTKGEQRIEEIRECLLAEGEKTTLQGVYKSVRRLLDNGIILKHHATISINNEWAENLLELLEQAMRPLKLASGESQSYSFKLLSSLDAQWKHIMAPLEKSFADYPVFLYNPYDIWHELPDRRDSEIAYYRQFAKDKRYCFCLLGKQNIHNSAFKQSFQDDFLQISVGNELFSDRDHIAVISDYVITTKLPPALVKAINAIYESCAQEFLPEKISALFSKSTAIKLKIERNRKKASLIRQKIAKDFYLPKELKEKYQLFTA